MYSISVKCDNVSVFFKHKPFRYNTRIDFYCRIDADIDI